MYLRDKDIELYYYLFLNCRFTNKEIARALHTTEPNVLKKIRKIENTIIKKYDAILSLNNLPLKKIWYFVNTRDLEQIKKIDSVYVLFETASTYRYIVGCLFKNPKEQRMFEKKIKPQKSIEIEQYYRRIPAFMRQKVRLRVDQYKEKAIELDSKDIKILEMIADGGARLKLIDIANLTNLSYDIVKYRFKRLIENGYFLWFVAQPHQENHDFRVSYITLKLKNSKSIPIVASLDNVLLYSVNKKNEMILAIMSESSKVLFGEIAEMYDKINHLCTDMMYFPLMRGHVINRYPLHKLLK